MQQIDYPPVQQVLQLTRDLSAEVKTRRLAFARQRALSEDRPRSRGTGRGPPRLRRKTSLRHPLIIQILRMPRLGKERPALR